MSKRPTPSFPTRIAEEAEDASVHQVKDQMTLRMTGGNSPLFHSKSARRGHAHRNVVTGNANIVTLRSHLTPGPIERLSARLGTILRAGNITVAR
jgi:hypothetical protein